MGTVTDRTHMYRWLFRAACVFLAGCSAPQDPVSFTALPYVQAPSGATAFYDRDLQRVFNRSCTGGCHEPGGSGERQAGLLLTEAFSYVELLDPTVSKNGPHVIPGDAENSPLIWKLEGKDSAGRPVFGDPMPLGRPLLSSGEIDAIRTWIREGAVRSLAPPVPPSVLSAASLDSTHVEVRFSEEVERASAESGANYRITGESDLQVLSARLDGPDRVQLETSPQAPGLPYTVVVGSVRDLSGDAVVAGEGDRATFRFSPVISFASQIVPIVDNNCAFAGCHASSDRFPPGEGLVLEADAARANLVDRPSRQQGTLRLVKPKDPDASYLILKLEGAPGITGDRMPQGGPYLSPAEIQQFRLWIEQGAEEN